MAGFGAGTNRKRPAPDHRPGPSRILRYGELRARRFHGKTAAKCSVGSNAMTYRAPINDILLALNHGAGLQAALAAGHYGDFDGDITAAVLEEAGKFASDVLAPLNKVGDEHGIKLDDGKVTTAPACPHPHHPPPPPASTPASSP